MIPLQDPTDSALPPRAKKVSILSWLQTRDQRGAVAKRPWELFLNISFYTLCLAIFCGSGSGLTIIFNIGSLARSFGGGDTDTVRLVTLLSIFNCTGRLFNGIVSDRLSRWFSRPVFLMLCLALMGISHAALSFTDDVLWLYPAVVLVGFSYGGIYAIFPIFVSERFGVKHFGANYNMANISAFLASNVFAWISGHIYDAHINAENHQCFGSQCYQWTLRITASSCAVGTLLCFLLILLNRKFYSSSVPSRDAVAHSQIPTNSEPTKVGST